MKKILYIIDSMSLGGTEKQLVLLINNLDQSIFIPYLCCLKKSDSLYTEIKCTKMTINYKSFKSIKILSQLARIIHFIKKNNIDLVQTFFQDATILGVIAAKLCGVKLIIASRRDLGFWQEDIHKNKQIKFIDRFVDKFLVNSNAIKEQLFSIEGISQDKIEVIYNGIDIAKIKNNLLSKKELTKLKNKLKLPQDNFNVGIIANLNRPVKKVDIFIRAACEVVKQRRDVNFIVLGNGYLSEELKELTHKLNINENFYFLGRKPDIVPFLSLFDVGVMTSDSEGFPNAIIEYLAAQIPVVATKVGGIPEIIENGINGFLAQKGDYKQIANYIIKIINNYPYYEKKELYERINEFDISRYIEDTQNYYLVSIGKSTEKGQWPELPATQRNHII